MPENQNQNPTAAGSFQIRTQRWQVGAENLSKYRKNISDWNADLLGILKTPSKADLESIIQAANDTGTKIHPLSRGANWGFGSKLPSTQGTWLLDLSPLNKISDFDSALGVVTVEPGVSQGMLDDFLSANAPEWSFNVTGSGRETSLVGNIVQRGVGYFGLRVGDLISCEVIRGDGKRFVLPENIGKCGRLYSHGLGPNWQSVILQSNLGVVVSMTLRLKRRSPSMEGFLVQVPTGSMLPQFIDVLAGCLQEGWLTSVPHIGNRRRTIETLGPYLPEQFVAAAQVGLPEWSALIPLAGPARVVDEMASEMRRRLGDSFVYSWIGRPGDNPQAAPLLAVTKELARFVQGRATDVALPSVAWPQKLGARDVDESPRGLRYLNALIPLTGAAVDKFLSKWKAKVEAVSGILAPSMTLNAITPQCLVAIISLTHERSSEMIQQADNIYEELARWLYEQGYPPYRLTVGTSQMKLADSSINRSLTEEVKAIWDPNGILV